MEDIDQKDNRRNIKFRSLVDVVMVVVVILLCTSAKILVTLLALFFNRMHVEVVFRRTTSKL